MRPSDLGPPRATRLAVTCAITIGSLALLWLIGMLGYRLGYAPATRVPDLLIDPSGAFASGAMMVVAIPGCVLDAGLAAPLPLMGILLLMALPAGALAAARPTTPGGPPVNPLITGLASTGAVIAILAAIAAIAWTGLPLRTNLLGSIPVQAAETEAWFQGIRAAAGFDLAVTGALVLFTILLTRLPIALWLRVLSLCAAGFALCVVITATSVSLGAAAHIGAAHAVVRLPDGHRAVLLGHTPHQIALLRIEWQPAPAEGAAPPTGNLSVRVIGPDSGIAAQMHVEARGSIPWFASGQPR